MFSQGFDAGALPLPPSRKGRGRTMALAFPLPLREGGRGEGP